MSKVKWSFCLGCGENKMKIIELLNDEKHQEVPINEKV